MWGAGTPPAPWPPGWGREQGRGPGGGEGGLREAGPATAGAPRSAGPHCRTRASSGRPRPRRQPCTWTPRWRPAAPPAPAAARTCSSRCTSTSTAWRSAAGAEVGVARLPPPHGAPQGLGARGPHRHLPALCFQCPEAAAACISSTWVAVRGHPAGAGRPPGDPRVCLCRPWAVSSWPWSVEPSTCPTGEWWAPRWALVGVAPGSQPGHGGPVQGAQTAEPLGYVPLIRRASLPEGLCVAGGGGPGPEGCMPDLTLGSRHGPVLGGGLPPSLPPAL